MNSLARHLVLLALISPLARASADRLPQAPEKSASTSKRDQATDIPAQGTAKTLAPTLGKVAYGLDPRQFLDFYQVKADQPTPVIIYIHGGAWNGGSAEGITRTDVFGTKNKQGEGVREVLNQGISVVSVEYRFVNHALQAGAKPPVEWPLRDAARADILPWIQEYSPISWASADDPPVYLGYSRPLERAGQPQLDSVHGAAHGVKLKETLDRLGVECHLGYPGSPDSAYRDHLEFLVQRLKREGESRK